MKVFVDTSAWCALVDAADKQHSRAATIWQTILNGGDSLVTTDYIFDETVTLLRQKLGHLIAVEFGTDLLASKVCSLVEVNRDIRQKAWDIFVKYKDKKFSFTDCTSFAIVDDQSIKQSFAFDAHFKQYGLSLLS